MESILYLFTITDDNNYLQETNVKLQFEWHYKLVLIIVN